MNIRYHFTNMLNYEMEANRDTLSAMLAAGGGPEKARSIFAHIQAVRDLWLLRLKHTSTKGFDPFPAWDLTKSETVMQEMDVAWTDFLDQLTEKTLDESIRWEDTKGGFWSSRAYDVVVQALSHSAHHRGQIALLLRQAGKEPMRVDYIAYRRTKAD